MAGAAGPNTAEAGLVFAYDTGNIITSYIGEPTTNIAYAVNDHLSSQGNWWINGGNATFNDNDTSIPKPVIPNVNTSNLYVFSSLVTGTGSNQQLGSSVIGISPSTTYSFSIWYYFTGTYMQAYPYIRTVVNNDSIGTFAYNGDTNGANWPKNQWILLKATGTTQANETGIYMSSYTGTALGDKVYYFGYQVEQKSHCTPLVLGTRSATQGLLDLTGASTIDLTDVSFDSNAQMVFDGTNDYVNIPYNSTQNLTSQGTVSVWIYPFSTTQGSYAGLVAQCTGGGTNQQAYQLSWRQISNALYGAICNGSGTYNEIYATLPSVANTWYNIVFTWNGSQLTMYSNGTAVGTATQTVNNQVLVTDLTVGGYTYKGAGGGGEYFNGKIANVETYNRGLTANEVAQNFQALRYRFGV